MPIAAVILALALIGAIVGGATVLGAPVFALPIVALLLAGWLVYALGRRLSRRSERGDDGAVAFTEEDRATLVPSPTPHERRRNRREAARAIRR